MPQVKGAAAKGLRPCKRYICTHDKNGKSVYAESPEQVFNATPKFGGLARSYSVASVPANLTNDEDIKAYRSEEGPTSYRRREIVNTEAGPNLLVVDLEPGAKSAMHRTVSIDFSICVQGEIIHELDGGEKVRLHPGVFCDRSIRLYHRTSNVLQDHIVQRGTNHRWHNPSKTESARFVAMSLPAIPFDIAGEPLKEKHIASDEWDRRQSKL